MIFVAIKLVVLLSWALDFYFRLLGRRMAIFLGMILPVRMVAATVIMMGVMMAVLQSVIQPSMASTCSRRHSGRLR